MLKKEIKMLNVDQLINKLFASRYHSEFTRSNSFIYRQQYYPEVVVNVKNDGLGNIDVYLCSVIDEFVTLDDVCILCDYGENFVRMFNRQKVKLKYFIVQNMRELESCRGVIGQYPDFEFVFFNDQRQISFYEGEIYEY
ncbi:MULTISPECIES: hypothetical protein [Sphingobacterium]|uniref:hypothetical protein n=1 Tax=Sphingobacterium TaxID=28453 RepID=UPI00257E3859|nr:MULTISPECIES: hypothetical protein [Sphingobacterium]